MEIGGIFTERLNIAVKILGPFCSGIDYQVDISKFLFSLQEEILQRFWTSWQCGEF